MVFIDLNAAMPPDVSEENRPDFIDAVNRRLERYERTQMDHEKSAYVFVTNMTAHRELMEPAQLLVIPTSVGISDFNRKGHFSLSELYRRDQKHLDALAVGESLSKLLSFPTTFDGSLPGISLNGDKSPIQIGQKYNFEGSGPDGTDLVGEVTDAIVVEDDKECIIAIYTDDQQAYLLKEPMTDGQLADYRSNKDAYFGKIKQVPKGIKTPYDAFLFFVEGQRGMSREKLLEHMQLSAEAATDRSQEELLLEYCERLVSGSGMFKIVNGVLTNEPGAKFGGS